MKALAEFLLSFESFQKALISLGWMRPAPKAFGPFGPPGSGGPSAPPPPSTPSPQPSPPPNDN